MERGRPRNFNKEQALDAALDVFWRNGYQNASLAELTRAMGINKPSLYSAFGNKEQLYLKTLQRYREQRLAQHAAALAAEPDLKQALGDFLRSIADMLTAPELPGGCMVVNSAVSCDMAALPPAIVAAIHETVDQSSLTLLKDRLDAELRNRNLPGDTAIHRLVDFFIAIMCGMAVMARLGADRDRLFDTIEQALTILPDIVPEP